MKKLTHLFLLCICITGSYFQVSGQIWKRIKEEVKSQVKQTTSNTSPDADPAVAVFGTGQSGAVRAASGDSSVIAPAVQATTLQAYKNYDFVPGDKIIFQPDMSGEPDAELPARFTVRKGTAEIQSFEGEKILHLQPDANTAVEPLMNSDHYLPEQFTLEFDMMYENNEGSYFRYSSDFRVGFLKEGDQDFSGRGLYAFVINNTSQCSFGSTGTQHFPAEVQKSFGVGNTWHHIAIYVRKSIGKAYVDAYRVCATNALPSGAGKFYIKADRYGIKIKNLRLAEGGDDKYKKIVTDGKFVTHGISFDVNKFSIKPESMGVLNEIATLMRAHNDLKFTIEGYTDSDGDDKANQKLSQSRAEAVRTRLISLGIDQSRLAAKGLGESSPIDTNETAEGKANNRRVEFVKR